MSNIYIDIGAYNGDSIEQFRNWSKLSFPDKDNWEIYAFEPNPKFKKTLSKKQDDHTHYYDDAAWIENGVKEFAVDDSDTPLGSTLMPGKKNIWDTKSKIKVTAFDFSEWITQFKDDFVVVKMDCEGAEFPILEKMIKDETIHIPYVLMVEFHPNKVVEYTTTHKNDLIRKLQKLGVNIKEWH